MLSLEKVQAKYGVIEALHDISLVVNEGEIVTVIGSNGAGKTTMLSSISGIHKASSGVIRFAGQEIQSRAAHEIVRLGICQSPEGRKIFPRLSVLENLRMGAFTRRDQSGIQTDIEKAFQLFPILQQRQTQLGGTLSGGEQQMLAIARALMGRPKLLLLDEPSLGLAPLIVLQILDVIRKLNQGPERVSVLLVEQNARLALKLAHRAYVVETGRITIEGPAADLLNDARVQEAYLGE
ncbi:MAG TPA: ABC transporter ATP-binding protein [Pirellulaceae bacterium]|nr:ABC transporter ATP-binding protein [Pirellulaceae bacterium]